MKIGACSTSMCARHINTTIKRKNEIKEKAAHLDKEREKVHVNVRDLAVQIHKHIGGSAAHFRDVFLHLPQRLGARRVYQALACRLCVD